jgi:hypothetical protein
MENTSNGEMKRGRSWVAVLFLFHLPELPTEAELEALRRSVVRRSPGGDTPGKNAQRGGCTWSIPFGHGSGRRNRSSRGTKKVLKNSCVPFSSLSVMTPCRFYDHIAKRWHSLTGTEGGAFKKYVLNDPDRGKQVTGSVAARHHTRLILLSV